MRQCELTLHSHLALTRQHDVVWSRGSVYSASPALCEQGAVENWPSTSTCHHDVVQSGVRWASWPPTHPLPLASKDYQGTGKPDAAATKWTESDLCLPFPAECTSLLKGKKTVWIGALLSDEIRAEKEVVLAPTDLQWGSMGRLLHFCQDGVGRPEQETKINTHLALCYTSTKRPAAKKIYYTGFRIL